MMLYLIIAVSFWYYPVSSPRLTRGKRAEADRV
jgi:hypothetical protein